MFSNIKIETIVWIWVVLNQLCNVRAAPRLPGSAEPDFDKWLSDFVDRMFLKQSRLIWDHSAWCSNLFDCIGPNGGVVKHQMCQFVWSEDNPSQCSRYKDFVIHDTDYNRWEFLHAHNELREMVANTGLQRMKGFGSNDIRRLTWDYSLEDMAANWAAQCLSGKDEACRRIQGHHYAGMSVEVKEFTSNNTSSITAMMAGWADSFFSIEIPKYPPNSVLIHYRPGPWDRGTQMVWHLSYKLGCASATFHDPPDRWYRIAVCYYAPPGNILGLPVFEEGLPGYGCTTGFEARVGCAGWIYPSLCATPEDSIDGAIPERTTARENPPLTNCCISREDMIYHQPTVTPVGTPPEPTDIRRRAAAREGRKLPGSLVNIETKEENGSSLNAGFAVMIMTFMLLIHIY